MLVTIFEKLPREDLERLQLVSTQFDDVIRNSSKLSEHEGPLRIVARLKLGASSDGSRLLQKSDVWLRDGTKVTCPDHKSLIKRLKFSTVEKLR